MLEKVIILTYTLMGASSCYAQQVGDPAYRGPPVVVLPDQVGDPRIGTSPVMPIGSRAWPPLQTGDPSRDGPAIFPIEPPIEPPIEGPKPGTGCTELNLPTIDTDRC